MPVQEVEVPKGLTPIDEPQAGASVSPPKVPKGLTPIGGTNNLQYAKPGNYRTTLSSTEENEFQQWAQQNKIPSETASGKPDPTFSASDNNYDMRGYFRALKRGKAKQDDKTRHFPDTWKTPYHKSFSNESQYALPTAPRWNQQDQLIDASGNVLFDEKKQAPSGLEALTPQEQIFHDTVNEGYSEQQAQQRQQEYDYAIKHGLSPERSKQFAMSMHFKSGAKENITEDQKAQITTKIGGMTEQERHQQFIMGDPKAWTEGYAEARRMGMPEEEAVEYASGNSVQRYMMRAGDYLGDKWTDVKTGMLHMIGANDTGHVTAREAAEAPLVATLAGQTERDYEFSSYKDADWVDKHFGKWLGTAQKHLDDTIAGFTTPDMAAIEIASLGTGAVARGTIGELADVAEEGQELSRAQRIGRGVGRAVSRIPGAERAGKVAEGAEKAVQAVREARVPVSAQRTARTIQKLAHAAFTAQMAQGITESVAAGFESARKGDYAEASGYAVDALVNGFMAGGGIVHDQAEFKIKNDLESKTQEVYGEEKKFGKLTDQQQAVVINKLVEDDPNYTAAANESEKEMAKRARILNRRYNESLNQAWNPNAAQRAIRDIHFERAETARKDAVGKVIQAIKDQIAQRTKEIEEGEKTAERNRQARRDLREDRKEQERIRNRSEWYDKKEVAQSREQAFTQRQENEAARASFDASEPRRTVDANVDSDGHVSYPAEYWGETQGFGVATDGERSHIYRQTGHGVEWLDRNGNFTDEPESLYFNADPKAADVLAQISSLKYTADSLAAQDDATAEQKAEASELSQIQRELASGDIDVKEAQKRARIGDKPVLPDEYMAARDGRLNGPFHERNAADYAKEVEESLRAMETPEVEIQATLETLPEIARSQVESNLHQVYKTGDYIISKKGVRWTLGRDGLLHPNDGGAPAPLLKNGRYSSQALQLASSGRVGYGLVTREQRRTDAVRRRDVAQQIREKQGEVDREMALAARTAGLELLPYGSELSEAPEKVERRQQFNRPPVPQEVQQARKERRAAYKASKDPETVINSLAKQYRITPEEVMRIALAGQRPATIEASIADLEIGDQITDDFRKDRPWVVEPSKQGGLQIRSGNAQPIPLDRLSPSERVKQIVLRGTIVSDKPEFTKGDFKKAAFEKAYIVHQHFLADQVKARKEGTVADPKPKTVYQAEKQAESAKKREDAAVGVATRATIEALDPKTTDIEEAVKKADAANQAVKTAEEAGAQEVEAQVQAVPENTFPQRAPATIGLKGNKGTIVQNGREHPFHYELLPLRSILTSHNWDGSKQVVNPEYPSSLQPRTISQDEAGQNALRAEIGQYDFRQYADKTISGATGPAIVDAGGHAVGGNTRLEIMKRHLQNLDRIADPEQRAAAVAGFRSAMREAANDAGIRRYPDDTEDYVVVRMLDNPIENEREAASLGRLFNKKIGVEISDSAKGISYSKSFTPALKEDIARRVEANDGIVPAMNADPQFFRDIVVNSFDVGPEEFANWFATKGEGKDAVQVLSKKGQDQFTKALIGSVISDPATLNRIEGTTAYRALERGLSYVVKMRALTDLDISAKIEEALAAAAEVQGTDPQLSKFADRWTATYRPDQQGLADWTDEAPPEPDRVVETLWRALNGSDAAVPRVFNDRLKSFIGEETSKGGWIFGEHKETPADRFNRAFSKELKEVAFTRGDKKEQLTEAEFDAALTNREIGDGERQSTNTETSKGGRGESPAIEAGLPEQEGERRRSENAAERLRFDQLSPEEKNKRFYTSEVTGLPNRRAFEEKNDPRYHGGKAAPIIGYADLDGLKAFNDTYGHDAGDNLLKAAAEAMKAAGVEAYHLSGDEFAFRANSVIDLSSKLAQARDILRKMPIEVEKQGIKGVFKGVDFSFGIGKDLKEADEAVSEHKVERRKSGELAERGQFGGIKPVGIVPAPKTETPVEVKRAIPKPPTAEDMLRADKGSKGYVTPDELKTFLQDHSATKENASELFRTARLMAEYVYETDPPAGVEKKDALAWVLKDRMAAIESGISETKRGEYSDPNIEAGLGTKILRLHNAADATTFIHEFAHIVFPMLSDADLKAVDSIVYEGRKSLPKWDGTRKGLTKEVYASMSEKLAHGLEKFLRDQNPRDFGDETKGLLGKLKDIFRKVYLSFKGDPLSNWRLGSDSVELFDKMFHITGSDLPDEWREQVRRARSEERRFKKPEETPHPLQKLARDMNADGIKESIDGRVDESIGNRVDPKKPTMAAIYNTEEAAKTAFLQIIEGTSKIENAELIQSTDGKWAIRFNTETKPPRDILNQGLPEKEEKTDTPEFRRWFGDSKVTDEGGNPLRVYHGTTGDFEVFDQGRASRSSGHATAGLGFFFSDDPSVASLFAGGVDDTQWPPKWRQNKGANTVPVFLSIKKPFELTADKWRDIVTNNGADGEPQFKENAKKYIQRQRDLLEKQGYDGVHIKGDPKFRDSMTEEYGHDNWVAFKPEQIKSAIANRGTFDPRNPSMLYQNLPERHPGLQLEDLQERLRKVPPYKIMERKLLQIQIDNLKNRIRADHGIEERKPVTDPVVAKKAVEEAKSGKGANGVRKVSDVLSRPPQSKSAGGLPRPPQLGVPGHAGSAERQRGAGRNEPRSLADVKPVNLLPLTKERGMPKGVIERQDFDQAKWVAGLKRAGLPENAPAPTYTLNRQVAEKLIFPGQKQVVSMAMSALEQGDGFVIVTPTGTGKSYTASAIIRETQLENPNARILYVTRNRKLSKKTAAVADGSFGFKMSLDVPKDPAVTGSYATTYAGLRNDMTYRQMDWDLVLFDESGEMRRWFDPDTKQGKIGMEVAAKSKKAVYASATPFHSPSEYGYLEKLNLWRKGEFDNWIEQNFAHKKVGDKIVAELDPGKQAKLRQQLIERGQLISQAISYEGLTAHFGIVPVTDEMKRGLDRIKEGFDRARSQFLQMGKKGLAEKVSAFEATYTKSFLERERLPQAIQVAKLARSQGYQVAIFSEHSAQDLFRRTRDQDEGPSTYQELDDAMGGQLSKIIPPFPDVYDTLRRTFGTEIGDYSGRGNTDAERDKAIGEFMKGETPMLYSTYAAGGIGVDMHDADFPDMGVKGGDKPRVFLFLGPPYSGVLLEQAMGRGWRFGVKSNTALVFLATDSEPDVRLMQGKVGPRMRALRAAVVGENDSLASAMAAYTDEEKIRERQDMLAYDEGNEEKVTASRFQVRSKQRQVGIQDWSAIKFPPADTAKNKGMKYGEDVPGGDWSTLYQSKFGLFDAPEPPENKAGKDVIDGIGNGIVSGQGLPEGVSVQNLDPASKATVTGAASAVAANEVAVPADRDKEAVARQALAAQLNMPGDRNQWVLTWPKGAKVGVWKYLGNPEDLRPTGEPPTPEPRNVKTWYIGNVMSQEMGIRGIARQAGVREIGNNIVRMNRSWQADKDLNFSQLTMTAADVMAKNKIDVHDKKAFGELWDVVEGKWSSADPKINKAAGELSAIMEMANDAMADAHVKIKIPTTGEYVEYSEKTRDAQYMPHRIDWDAKVEDPFDGKTYTLREIMGRTFAEEKRARIIQAISASTGMTSNQVVDYLNRYRPGTPVLGNVQRARTLNFPIYRKDWETLLGYFDQVAEAIATEKNFGTDRSKLNAEIDKIPSVNGRSTINSMFDGLLGPQDWSGLSAKFYNAMIGYEALSKMTLSAVKVPYHLVHAPLSMGGRVVPIIHALARTALHPREVMERAAYVGTVARQLNVGDLIGEGSDKGLAHAVFEKTMFNAFYRWGRAIAGESARVWMEQYAFNELKKGGTAADHTRRLLKETMLIGDQAMANALAEKRWAPEDLAKAQVAFANFTMFSDNPLQMPGWARLEVTTKTPGHQVSLHRAIRLTYALQSFSLKTTSILREKLFDEVFVHKNYKPLAYFLMIYPIVGELLRGSSAGTKAAIQMGISGWTGKAKHDKWDDYFTQLKAEASSPMGLLKRYIDNITFGIAWDRTRRLADPLFDMAMGKKNKSVGYALQDEIEQDIGAAWSTLVMKPIELGVQEYQIGAAQHTAPGKKHEKEDKKLIQFLADEWPVTKELPALQDWLKKKKGDPVSF